MLSALRARSPVRARAEAVELLDTGELSSREVEQNLDDLARLNRLLPGGVAASVEAVRRLTSPGLPAHILDVGTGRGDMPIAFARNGWRATALDSNPMVLEVARRTTAEEPLVEVVEGECHRLPFGDASFDVAHCSLLVHHFDPDDAVRLLRELARVARHGVVVNDLRRGLLPLSATWVSTRVLARSRVTLADGLASARRAYTIAELDDLLAAADLVASWRSTAWLPRVVTAAAVRR